MNIETKLSVLRNEVEGLQKLEQVLHYEVTGRKEELITYLKALIFLLDSRDATFSLQESKLEGLVAMFEAYGERIREAENLKERRYAKMDEITEAKKQLEQLGRKAEGVTK